MKGRTGTGNILFRWLALAMAAAMLAACGAGITGGRYKVGNAYQVDGQWYYPEVDLAYEESGIASWYGPQFHKKKTANGEIFDMNLVSAAHKTLPLPSVVRVTNLENGRSLIIRINDRGPFVRGRIIDLSKRAAELLGFDGKGTAMVHVRLLPDESRRAALDAGASAEDMASFGGKAPLASPTVDVSVESLAANPEYRGYTPSLPPGGVAAVQPSYGVPALAPEDATGPRPQAAPFPGQPLPPYAGGLGQPGTPPPPAAERPAPVDIASLPRNETVEQVPVKGRPNIFIQAGAFREFVNANRLRAQLTTLGHPVAVSQVYITEQPFFRVRLGPLYSVEEADRALQRVVSLGYPEAQIVVD